VLLVLAVHLCKVLHVGQEYVDFDDLVNAGSSGGEYSFDSVAASGGFLRDGTLDEFAGGEGGDLSGDVD
jgi:hypothetical protein